jgi:hypothetical protein
MNEIHREFSLNRDEKSDILHKKEKNNPENKAVAASPEAPPPPAHRPAPAAAQPLPASRSPRPRFPSLRLDAALLLSATALQFYASVRAPNDVCCLVSDASHFVARHVQVYCKVWAAWEWQRLAEHELMQHVRQSVSLLPEAGVVAAAGAAAALMTWPW